MIKIVFVGEVGDLSQISSSGAGKMWSNPNYILKVTTIGVAHGPDVWSEEKRKSRVISGVSACNWKNDVTTGCDD